MRKCIEIGGKYYANYEDFEIKSHRMGVLETAERLGFVIPTESQIQYCIENYEWISEEFDPTGNPAVWYEQLLEQAKVPLIPKKRKSKKKKLTSNV